MITTEKLIVMDNLTETKYFYPLFTPDQVKDLYRQAKGGQFLELSNSYNPEFIEVTEDVWQSWGQGREKVDKRTVWVDSEREERQMLDSGELVAGIVEYTHGSRSFTVRIYGKDAATQQANLGKFLGAAGQVVHDSWIPVAAVSEKK